MAAACLSISGYSAIAYSSDESKSSREYHRYADVHFHASNYAAQGLPLKKFIDEYMFNGNSAVFRSVIMPIPLQQRWDSFEGYQVEIPDEKIEVGPNYYLGPKADLYYYSFVDAMYAKEFLSLNKTYQERLDLMITAFNPMDIYAYQHIKRAVLTFPGAFSDIGEFTIHKETVSSKLAGDTIAATLPPGKDFPQDDYTKSGKVSLYVDSFSKILKTTEEIGLVATLHNDLYRVEVDPTGEIVTPYPSDTYEAGLIALCKKAPNAKVIWAHGGLGRYVKPNDKTLGIINNVLKECNNWSIDISWDLVQDYIINPGEDMPSGGEWRKFFEENKQRVLWGTDAVAFTRNIFKDGKLVTRGALMPLRSYQENTDKMNTFLESLDPTTAENIRMANYERLFDAARVNVRRWERAHSDDNVWNITTPR